MEVTDGIFLNLYVYVNGLSHTVSYLQQVEMVGSYIITHHLTAFVSHLKL